MFQMFSQSKVLQSVQFFNLSHVPNQSVAHSLTSQQICEVSICRTPQRARQGTPDPPRLGHAVSHRSPPTMELSFPRGQSLSHVYVGGRLGHPNFTGGSWHGVRDTFPSLYPWGGEGRRWFLSCILQAPKWQHPSMIPLYHQDEVGAAVGDRAYSLAPLSKLPGDVLSLVGDDCPLCTVSAPTGGTALTTKRGRGNGRCRWL